MKLKVVEKNVCASPLVSLLGVVCSMQTTAVRELVGVETIACFKEKEVRLLPVAGHSAIVVSILPRLVNIETCFIHVSA